MSEPQPAPKPRRPDRGRAADDTVERRFADVLDRAVEWDPPRCRTVVVAPHPDDEVLMAGGLIATQAGRGVDLVVVAVTDGEAAYPELDPGAIAEVRRAEQARALATVAGRRVAVLRLGMSDGSVALDEGALSASLVELVDESTLLVSPWERDWHPDHEAVGRAARRAADQVGCELRGAMFWTWHHRGPEDLAGRGLVALHLDDEVVERRRRAVADHVSQTTDAYAAPILTERLLEPLRWSREHYVAPAPAP
ncbi:PIG-L deacetylase family protein [Ilumatobacter sp.]|uniref:PIG-L deacetylase family protein n=1 Tax=Ilumatobacter sp. TaxID=1967498 RepID=UPI003B528AB2